jgi:peptidoglycan/xylan/chitin deacetylase (PgdA/CDA1 family)
VWISEQTLCLVLDRVAAEPTVRMSFDDGNASDVELALPRLIERGLSATFFVVADRIGRDGYASASDLRALVGAGMEIGSHGLTHRSWRGLAAPELSDELVRSRALIEDAAGTAVNAAACPFGAYDRRVLNGLREAGYSRVYTSDGGAARDFDWLQPRNSLRTWDDDALVDRLLTARPAQLLACRAKSIVKALR